MYICVVPIQSKAKNLMGAGLYLSRQMEFNTAGMKQLKALLRESSLRIIATRGAQSYVDHVENCSVSWHLFWLKDPV